MLQKAKEKLNSVDTASLKKSVSNYWSGSPQPQGDTSDVESVSSEKAPSITELSEASDQDLSSGKAWPRRSGEVKDLESRLQEQLKLKTRLSDMLEQQQDKSKAESREVRRSYELKLQEQQANLSEEIGKKGKMLEKSKVVIQELNKNVQELKRDNEMESVQHAMELEKLKIESEELKSKTKRIDSERQRSKEQLDTSVAQQNAMSGQVLAMEDANAKQVMEISRLHEIMQNSTDKGSDSEHRWQQLLEQITRERNESRQECASLQKREAEVRREFSDINKTLESSVQSLETELSKCRAEITRLEGERDKISQELNSQLSELRQEVSEGRDLLIRRQEESSKELSTANKFLGEAKQLLQGKEQEVVRLSGEGERQRLQISKLQKDSERNLQELRFSLQKEKTSGDELGTLVEQVKLEKAQELESLYSSHDEEKKVLIDQNSDLKKQLADTLEQLTGVTSSSMSAQQKHRGEVVRLEKDKLGLEDQVMKAKSERAELQQMCLELEKGLKQHKTGEEGYRGQLETVCVRFDSLQEKYHRDVERLEMRADLLSEQLTASKTGGQGREVELQTLLSLARQQLEQERVETSQSVEGLNNQISILDQTILSCSEKCEQLGAQLAEERDMKQQVGDSMQCEVERLGAQIRKGEETLNQAMYAEEDVQRQLDTAKQMIAGKNDNLKTSLQEKSSLQVRLEDMRRELEESTTQCQDLSQYRDKVDGELSDFSTQLKSLLTTLLDGSEGMREKVADRMSGLDSKLKGLEGIVEQLGNVREENGSLRNELTRLQTENIDHQEKLQKKSLEIKQLQQRQIDLKKMVSRELKMQPSQPELSLQEQQLVASSEDNGSLDSTPLLPIDTIPNSVLQHNDNESHITGLPFPPALRSTSMLTLPTLSRQQEDLIDLSLSSPIGEINFQYLRNIMLQYMCSNPADAKQLHKALFTLLSANSNEQAAVNQFWEYRESWFGFKTPPKFRSIVPQSNEL